MKNPQNKLKIMKRIDWENRKKIVAIEAAKILYDVPDFVHKHHLVQKNVGTPDKPVLKVVEDNPMIPANRELIAHNVAKWHLEKKEEAMLAYAKRSGVRDADRVLISNTEGDGVILTRSQRLFALEAGDNDALSFVEV